MDEPKTTSEETNLSRRELLKALAAAGGALGAAAFLPGKWTKPLVEAGVLPAHAQGTQILEIDRLRVLVLANSIGHSQTSVPMYVADFQFLDSLCEVTKDSAKLCGVSERTWRSWDAGGLVPQALEIGHSKLWRRQELEEWTRQGCPDREAWQVLSAGETP